jgi:hypothetical protein
MYVNEFPRAQITFSLCSYRCIICPRGAGPLEIQILMEPLKMKEGLLSCPISRFTKSKRWPRAFFRRFGQENDRPSYYPCPSGTSTCRSTCVHVKNASQNSKNSLFHNRTPLLAHVLHIRPNVVVQLMRLTCTLPAHERIPKRQSLELI